MINENGVIMMFVVHFIKQNLSVL